MNHLLVFGGCVFMSVFGRINGIFCRSKYGGRGGFGKAHSAGWSKCDLGQQCEHKDTVWQTGTCHYRGKYL